MSSLSATQSDGYYLPPEYFESGAYKKVSRNRFAAEQSSQNHNHSDSGSSKKPLKVGHNQWLKHGVVRFELPEKVVCLGCKQSIGRGTRYNARKTKTDQSYFTTPIFEFALSCRNCKEPWVIRTDPKERGFEYISGVKRQAGQDRNLVEDGTTAVAAGNSSSLDKLEAGIVAKQKNLTEIEKLQGLVKLNQRANAGGKDVEHNAFIRKSFRTDRRETRKTLMGGKQLGWKSGMALLPANDSDLLLSKETCYGRASVEERSKLSRVRKSSIFGSPKKHKKKKRNEDISNRIGNNPDIVGSAPDLVPSGSEIVENLPQPTPNTISSSMNNSSSSVPRKTKLVLANGIVSIASKKNNHPRTFSQKDENGALRTEMALETKTSRNKNNTPIMEDSSAAEKPSLSFLDLVGGYGSSDDEG